MATTDMTPLELQVFNDAFLTAYAQYQELAASMLIQAQQGIGAGQLGYVDPIPTTVTLPFNDGGQTDPDKPASGTEWAFERAVVDGYQALQELRHHASFARTRRLALSTPDTKFVAVLDQAIGEFDIDGLNQP